MYKYISLCKKWRIITSQEKLTESFDRFFLSAYTINKTVYIVYLPGNTFPSSPVYIRCCTNHKWHRILYMYCYMHVCNRIHNIRKSKLNREMFYAPKFLNSNQGYFALFLWKQASIIHVSTIHCCDWRCHLFM